MLIKVDINLLFNVINILVLAVLVKLFLLKPVHKILAERQAAVDKSITDAEAAKAEAIALEQQHADLMRNIEDEKLAVIADAQKRAAGECDMILTDAKQRADGIVRNAESQALSRKEEIMRQTKSEITEIIVAATAKVSGVGTSKDSALYDEFLKKAGESDGENSK